MAKYNNIEDIMTQLEKEKTNISEFRKFDGITIECTIKSGINIDEEIERIKQLCKKLKFPSSLTEKNLEETNKFILQFPDFEPSYTEEQIEALYNHNIKLVLDNSFYNDYNYMLNNEVVKQNKDTFINELITMYYKSMVNKYKHTLKEFLNNEEIRTFAGNIFDIFIKDYKYEGKRVIVK